MGHNLDAKRVNIIKINAKRNTRCERCKGLTAIMITVDQNRSLNNSGPRRLIFSAFGIFEWPIELTFAIAFNAVCLGTAIFGSI